MHALEAFLLALGDRSVNGRVLVLTEHGVRLKYLLLNPADAFQPLVDATRAVILAGGTMEPVCRQTPLTDTDVRLSHTTLRLGPRGKVHDLYMRAHSFATQPSWRCGSQRTKACSIRIHI